LTEGGSLMPQNHHDPITESNKPWSSPPRQNQVERNKTMTHHASIFDPIADAYDS